MENTIVSLKFKIDKIYCFSDSTIVLAWIKTEPFKLKTFIANRVSTIQEFNNFSWKHVSSENNPADCLSRSMSAHELKRHDIWWNDPCLNILNISEPILPNNNEMPELKNINIATVLHINVVVNNDMFEKFSTYNKLCKVTAYMLRFINNCRSNNKLHGNLSVEEIENAEIKLIHLCQQQEFKKEFQSLKQGNALPTQSKLVGLKPFLCDKNIIRVGGRLQHSDLTYSQKHQVVLPSHHLFTTMIVKHYHNKNLHAGNLYSKTKVLAAWWRQNSKENYKQMYYLL